MRYLLLALILLFPCVQAAAQPVQQAALRSKVVHNEPSAVYPDHLDGRRMANGAPYNARDFTAAHRSLPLGTLLRVTDPATQRSVIVRIADRGPFSDGISLLLSGAAAQRLGMDLDSVQTLQAIITLSEPPSPLSSSAAMASSTGADELRQPDSGSGQHVDRASDSGRATPGGATMSETETRFAIQLGSYSTLRAAETVAKPLEGAWIARVDQGERVVYRIYFGRYRDRETAEDWAARLARLGWKGFVKTVPLG